MRLTLAPFSVSKTCSLLHCRAVSKLIVLLGMGRVRLSAGTGTLLISDVADCLRHLLCGRQDSDPLRG